MALAIRAIFIEFILWLRALPSRRGEFDWNTISIPLRVDGVRRRDFVIKGNSSKIGKYREMRRDKWTTRRCKFLKGSESAQRRKIESINLSENLRSEIKLFSCNFYDMYPFSSEMLLSSQCRSTACRRDFVAQGKLRQTLETNGKCNGERIARSKDGLFQRTMKMERGGIESICHFERFWRK